MIPNILIENLIIILTNVLGIMVPGAMICVTFMALVISANADVEPSIHGANMALAHGTVHSIFLTFSISYSKYSTQNIHETSFSHLATCMKPLISGDEHNVSSEYITASTSWPGHGPESHGPERSRLYTVKDSNGM